MKILLQSALAFLLATSGLVASASEASPKLSVAMALIQGETVVGSPRVVVLNGERATVEVGPQTGDENTGCTYPRGWWVDITPKLEAAGEVSTSIKFKSFKISADCVPSSRNVSMKTVQKLGATILLTMPASNYDPELLLSIKTDIIAE
ncbi:MAG: hypothetical protein ABL931_15765 [Usitatibacteraceae bacterium]